MFKFTFLPQKKISEYIVRINENISLIINFFSLKNLYSKSKLLIKDKRTIITSLIIFFSIFAHLSTPAFYKDEWVKQKIRNQLENKYSLKINFSDKFYYSIFPVPNFVFKDVIIFSEKNKKLIEIEKLTTNLSYKKFFDKDKMNIQHIIISKANFNLKIEDVIDYKNFFKKKINDEVIKIKNSKIFFINKDDDVSTIVSLKDGETLFENLNYHNILSLNGNIFNTPFKFSLKNQFDINTSIFNFNLPELNINMHNKMKYSNDEISGNLDYIFRNRTYSTNYSFNEKYLEFKSQEKFNDHTHFYKGNIRFNPFSSLFEINLNSIDLLNLFSEKSIFVKILKSNLLKNENFYSKLNINSKNSSTHRKIKNFSLKTNFENNKIDFNGSSFIFEDTFNIQLIESVYENNINEQYIAGKIEINIQNEKNLFKLFQTKKDLRKKLEKINFDIKYDYLQNTFQINNIRVNEKDNEQLRILSNQFNAEKKQILKRIDYKNYFNYMMGAL